MNKKISEIQRLQNQIHKFQLSRFPKQTVKAKLKHLKREIDEIIKNPKDRSEWADAFILFLGAIAVQGIPTKELLKAARSKMIINWKRKWGKPDKHGVFHHK